MSQTLGTLEFQNQMRAYDMHHKEMVAKINMYTRKMEAKQKNSEKFREVRQTELQRELDDYENALAAAKVSNERKLKQLNDISRRRRINFYKIDSFS